MGKVSEMATQMGAIPARARRTDPITSHDAAARKSMRPSSHGAKIRLALMQMPDRQGTSYEIAEVAKLTQVQVARMMKTLATIPYDYVADTGSVKPSGPGGNDCIIWRLR